MERKRNFNRELITSDPNKNVFVPFNVDIPAGHSTFTVPVPTRFSDREFFFSNVVLVPDFYSQQAAGYDLDVQEELDQLILYDLYLKVNFKTDPKLHPASFTPENSVTTTAQFAKRANDFFETNKPIGLQHLGCFFDWIDIRYEPISGQSWDDYIKIMAVTYYGEPYNEAKHFNALPVSARTVYGANNYLYPTRLSDVTLENLRFRFNIAPNTNALFSTNGQLQSMGFSNSQIGDKVDRNRHVMENDNKTHFETIEAENEAKVELTKDHKMIMSLQVNQKYFSSEVVQVSLTKGESYKNENYLTLIKTGLRELANQCNIEANFSYDSLTKVFSFTFPNNRSMDNFTIVVPTELAERLGFGLIRDITENNKTGEKADDTIDVKEMAEKAIALAMDTSLVIISDDNTSSNLTAGIHEKYMAALYATGTGTMEIPEADFCQEPAKMKMPSIYTGSTATIPATFRLSRYLDGNRLVNLVWKTGAYIYGTLRGVQPQK